MSLLSAIHCVLCCSSRDAVTSRRASLVYWWPGWWVEDCEVMFVLPVSEMRRWDCFDLSFSPVHTVNNVEATFDFVERIVRLVAFDNVASTLLLVWTGLYSRAADAAACHDLIVMMFLLQLSVRLSMQLPFWQSMSNQHKVVFETDW